MDTRPLARFATGTNNIYQPITTFGDGVQYIFKCLVGIIYAGRMGEDRIMIDEIDTGIHYLKMKEFWNAIIYIAQRRGIQIFATTHSMDCIKAFVEAGEENELIKNDLRLIELEEFTNKDGIIKHTATTFNHETLKYKIEMNTNVLGGDVWR
jgi:AAA15 family ATPase/GTPase